MVKAWLVVVSCGGLLAAELAQAMQIRAFDKLAGDDQITYVNDLIDSVEASVPASELPRVKRFFREKQPGEVISGMGQFELNLSMARVADLEQADKNPRARPLAVEDVMYVTLERNGISLPAGFRPAASNFHPKLPPRTEAMDKATAARALDQTRRWVARTVDPPHEFRSTSGGYALSDTQKGIAFFAALAMLAVAASAAGVPNGSPSSGPAPDTDMRPWWQQSGFATYHDAMHSACISSHIPTITGGYSGICD